MKNYESKQNKDKDIFHSVIVWFIKGFFFKSSNHLSWSARTNWHSQAVHLRSRSVHDPNENAPRSCAPPDRGVHQTDTNEKAAPEQMGFS